MVSERCSNDMWSCMLLLSNLTVHCKHLHTYSKPLVFGSAHTLLYALPVQVQLGVYMYDITDPCRVRGTHDMHAGLDFKVEFVGA